MYYDDETTADAMEAWSESRREADMEQAAMVAVGNRIHAIRQQGKCAHQSAVGYLPTPVYPEQQGLRPGQSRCTEGCGQVYNTDQEWYDAMEDALN